MSGYVTQKTNCKSLIINGTTLYTNLKTLMLATNISQYTLRVKSLPVCGTLSRHFRIGAIAVVVLISSSAYISNVLLSRKVLFLQFEYHLCPYQYRQKV